jgi:hypothetical protein
MSNLNVEINTAESLESLQARLVDGFSVMRSAHVGNARAYNLALAASGIPMLLVDHNVTGIDTNYRPEDIIQNGQSSRIARLGVVSMREMVTCPTAGTSIYLDALHGDSLARAFPGTDVITNTNYLREYDSIAGEIIKLSAEEAPGLFKRVLRKDEAISTSSPGRAGEQAKARGALQLQDDPRTESGVLVPNEVDIVCNFVIEALRSGQAVQYHISGPDMVKYIDRIMPTLQRLYAVVAERASFGGKLPQELQVELVPGTALKFVTTIDKAEVLDSILQAVRDFETNSRALRDQRKNFFQGPEASESQARRTFLGDITDREKQTTKELAQAARQLPDLFVGAKESPFVSQYDVLDNRLYIPASVKGMSMAQLQRMFEILAQSMKGAP